MYQLSLFDAEASEQEENFSNLCAALGVEQSQYWHDRFGEQLLFWSKQNSSREIRTLSLFSGAGGLDIGFHDAGFRITHAVEIDHRFAATLKKNTSQGGYLEGTEVICDDIRNFSLPEGTQIDFIIGGPPCQTFSAAGRRAAGVAGTKDERGTLFQEYVRLLEELQPRGFLFENVYGIIGAEGGAAWASIQNAFQNAGYTISARIIDAADYGVAQHRERLIIVGARKQIFNFPRPTHGPDSNENLPHVSAQVAIADIENELSQSRFRLRGRYGHLLEEIPPGLNYSFFTEEMGHPQPIFAWRSKFSDFLYKADPARPVRTLKAQGGQYTGPFHWESRPFTVEELKRLQGFPDKYELVGNRQVVIHQIGNSVPPQLARIMAMGVYNQIFGFTLPANMPTLRSDEELGFRKRKRELTKAYKASASSAIGIMEERPKLETTSRKYNATLLENFDWVENDSGALRVDFQKLTDAWVIHISCHDDSNRYQPDFEIELRPCKQRAWGLDVERVTLLGHDKSTNVFSAVWKAFEVELVRSGQKADLVQLSEYYQYQPRFNAKMRLAPTDDWRWNALGRVVEGRGTRKIKSGRELADELNIEEVGVRELLKFLKICGFEARSSETNVQLGAESFLIPYAFPTLTPLSVQLRKNIDRQIGDG